MTWWQRLVAFWASVAGFLTALGVVGKWGHRMWSNSRKFGRLLDQMLGDKDADPPLPSLMDQLADMRVEQARQADEQKRQADEQKRQARVLDEHVRTHSGLTGSGARQRRRA
jgi:hypothetical protein